MGNKIVDAKIASTYFGTPEAIPGVISNPDSSSSKMPMGPGRPGGPGRGPGPRGRHATGKPKKTKETILNFKANKIIYVSCDPMTLARDLKELSSIYNIKTVNALDMFPYTEHIETFCVLEKR